MAGKPLIYMLFLHGFGMGGKGMGGKEGRSRVSFRPRQYSRKQFRFPVKMYHVIAPTRAGFLAHDIRPS